MKINNDFKHAIFIILLLIVSVANAQVNNPIEVNSLLELKPYMSQDNVAVKLAPGDYYLNADDISSGNWGEDIPHFDWAKGIMIFSGSNSTYDFTGVTIYFNTNLFTAFGSFDVWELQISGNNNTLKNLTMVDDGSVYDAPSDGVTNVTMDGKNNIIDGFHVTGKGSSPYAWGDSFGKGAGSLVALQKHSNFLIRGDYNTIKNSTIIHKAFGHCLFMQAANHPTILDCYIQGEMRSTDDMLADPSIPNTPTTTWGYRLPSGYMKALCEEGIRTYNRGETLIDGAYIERGTNDIIVKNTTVKNARAGCSLVLSSGERYLENVTLIGCETGFSVGNATLVNCKADCTYGPAYMNAYDDKRNTITGDLTILTPSAPVYNGSGLAAFFGGSNSNLTIKAEEGAIAEGLVIKIGGVTDNVGQIGENPHTATGNTINNQTNYPIVIASGSSGNTITTCANVTNNGVSNTIINGTDCIEKECLVHTDTETPVGIVSGLKYYYYEGNWSELPNFNTLTPIEIGESTNGLDLSLSQINSDFGFRFFGYVIIPEAAEYTFYTTSDDGSKLSIDGALVVENSGSGNSEASGTICLEAGVHQFKMDVYETTGNKNLSVAYESSTISKQEVTAFYYVSSPKNVALNGVATQSTTGYGGLAARAIDGNTDGVWSNGSVTHTENGINGSGESKWWQVDLQSEKIISEITVFNRTDNCCKSRLNNFTVSVYDAEGMETFTQFFESAPNPNQKINLSNVIGQVVKIEKTSDYGLTLAEVQVLGVDASSLSTNNTNLIGVNVYPNPVKNILTISLDDTQLDIKKAKVLLYTISGQKVLEQANFIDGNIRIDLSSLNSGVYVLIFGDGNKNLIQKIIKE